MSKETTPTPETLYARLYRDTVEAFGVNGVEFCDFLLEPLKRTEESLAAANATIARLTAPGEDVEVDDALRHADSLTGLEGVGRNGARLITLASAYRRLRAELAAMRSGEAALTPKEYGPDEIGGAPEGRYLMRRRVHPSDRAKAWNRYELFDRDVVAAALSKTLELPRYDRAFGPIPQPPTPPVTNKGNPHA